MFAGLSKKLGFGCMRFPMVGEEVDLQEVSRMVDTFLEMGFTYFDTARGYLGGKSETALRECLTSRYPRNRYVLTNKLSVNFFEQEEDIRPLYQKQLQACGVDYFDFYLMHAQDQRSFAKYKRCRAYETALAMQQEGLFRYFGISFHDRAEVLEQILTEYPQIQVVQLQLNYVDFEDEAVQSRKCLEVCRKHGKPVIVMEPVKGGSLVELPEEAKAVFDSLGGGSYASYAIRFAAGQEGVFMVLSGMGDLSMVQDNCSYMQEFQPLQEREMAAVAAVCGIFRGLGTVACTGCRYCTQVCPQSIPIPEIFACLNAKKIFQNWSSGYYFRNVQNAGGMAADCIGCGACEEACPQHLPIRELLKKAVGEFQK